MKILITIIAITFCISPLAAQRSFTNTTWKPQTDNPRIRELQFTKDSLRNIFESDRDPQMMVYWERGDTLVVKRVSGLGACPETVEGWYRVQRTDNGDKILFQLIRDDCDGRVRGFTTNPYTRGSLLNSLQNSGPVKSEKSNETYLNKICRKFRGIFSPLMLSHSLVRAAVTTT